MRTSHSLLCFGLALAMAACDRAAARDRTDTTTTPSEEAQEKPADGVDTPINLMGPRRKDTGHPGSAVPRRADTGTRDTDTGAPGAAGTDAGAPR